MASVPLNKSSRCPAPKSDMEINRVLCDSSTQTLYARASAPSMAAIRAPPLPGTHSPCGDPVLSWQTANDELPRASSSLSHRFNDLGGPCLASQNTMRYGGVTSRNDSITAPFSDGQLRSFCTIPNSRTGAHMGDVPLSGDVPRGHGSILNSEGSIRCGDHSSNISNGNFPGTVEAGVKTVGTLGYSGCGVTPGSSFLSGVNEPDISGSDSYPPDQDIDVDNQHTDVISDSSSNFSHCGNSLKKSRQVWDSGCLPHARGPVQDTDSYGGNTSFSSVPWQAGAPPTDVRPGFFPWSSDASHNCQSDTSPLLRVRSDTGTGDLVRPRQQVLPKAFSWVLCRRMTEGILQGARMPVGQEPLLTKDQDPTTVSCSGSLLSDGPICRICHEGSEEGRLVRPCHCCGTLSYTHKRCLERWLQTKNEDICELCQYQFHTRRKDRPLREWLRRPARMRDRRNVVLDALCFCFLTPMVFISAWLCIHGAFYYLSYYEDRGLESLGLITLATILIVIFLLWSIVSLRYHCIIWKAWRRENQTVHVVVADRAPSLIRWEDSQNNNCSVVIPTGKPDINGNFLWLQSFPHGGDAFV